MIADLVLYLHFCFVIFITFGLFFIPIGYNFGWAWVINRKLRLVHCSLMAFVTIESLLGLTCPLTSIEQGLRGLYYSESFIVYWISHIIYWDLPSQFFMILYCICLGWVFLLWKLCPPRTKHFEYSAEK